MKSIRLRYLAAVNPPTPEFDHIAADADVTFMPLETVWAAGHHDASRTKAKAEVSTGYTRFRDGDILLPKVTPTFQAGRVARVSGLVSGVGAGTTELHVLRARPGVEPRFVAYALQTKHFIEEGVTAFQGVAGLQRVPDRFVRDFEVADLELAEQRRIADFLDGETARIDRLIALRLQQITLQDERVLAAISDVLCGGACARSGRPTGMPWLPAIPESWTLGPVYAYFDVRLGKMLSPERASGEHPRPYLRNANVHWFCLSVGDLAVMSFEPHERRRYRLEPGDLVVCEGGAGVAEAAVWGGEMAECYYQKSLHRVRRRTYLPVEWLMYWLRLAKASGVFASEGNVATIPHLTQEQLREYRVPIPPPTECVLRALDDEVQRTASRVSLLARSTDLLIEHRQALVTAAVTGQLDVTTARGVT